MNYYFCLSSCDGVDIAEAYCTAVLHLAAARSYSQQPSMVFSVSGSRDSLRYCFITKKPIHKKLGTLQQII